MDSQGLPQFLKPRSRPKGLTHASWLAGVLLITNLVKTLTKAGQTVSNGGSPFSETVRIENPSPSRSCLLGTSLLQRVAS